MIQEKNLRLAIKQMAIVSSRKVRRKKTTSNFMNILHECSVGTIVNVIEPDIDISRDVPDIPFWAHESNVDLILLPGKTNI